jgi:hypothetical protein
MAGAVTVLEAGDADAGEIAWQVASLRRGVDLMRALTSDFLDIHALSTGALVLAEAWTNVRELLEGCAREERGASWAHACVCPCVH